MGKVIGIVGSRRRDSVGDYDKLTEAFDKVYEDGDCIVSGGCPKGADRMAEHIARQREVSITIHYAKWRKFGRSAGPIRNTLIAKDCTILIALPASDRTGGTEDTIRKCLGMEKKVILI